MELTPQISSEPNRLVEAASRALQTSSRGDLTRHALNLTVEGEALVIRGEVPDVADKKVALECVAAVPGVDSVVDGLHVEKRLTIHTRPATGAE